MFTTTCNRSAACLFVLCVAGGLFAQRSESTVNDSYKSALGRDANGGEKGYWMGRKDWNTKADMVKFHMQGLQGDKNLRQGVIDAVFTKIHITLSPAVSDYWQKTISQQPRGYDSLVGEITNWVAQRRKYIHDSYTEALGRDPRNEEVTYWYTRTDYQSTADMVAMHVVGLKGNQAMADEMISSSYKTVFNYTPAPGGGEINHWRQHARLGWTHKQIVAEHQKWKQTVPPAIKSNQALVKTMQKQNVFLDTSNNLVKVSPAEAARIVAGGGGNIVAGGGGNIIAKAGTYLIGKGGAGLIGQDGASLIGDGGGT